MSSKQAVGVLFSPCHLASTPLLVRYVAGQNQVVGGRKAVLYAVTLTVGLFIIITAVGILCTLLGRMLDDVGTYMSIGVGAILVWGWPLYSDCGGRMFNGTG